MSALAGLDKRFVHVLLVGMLACASNVFADDSLGIRYKGLTIYPSLRLEYWFDDNIYSSSANQQSSNLTIIAQPLLGFGRGGVGAL